MTGQHLTVGVDINALAFSLLEEQFQIMEVMTSNQNTFILAMTQRYRGRNRITVSAGIACIQQLHSPQIDLSRFHGNRNTVRNGQAFSQHARHDLLADGQLGSV